MEKGLILCVEKILEGYYQRKVFFKKGSSIGGGCINNASLIETGEGDRFFLKYNLTTPPEMFQAEAHGLMELSKSGVIRIPAVIGYSEENQGYSCIILEYVPSGKKIKNYYVEFGRQLAELHKVTESRYGFLENNFIGSTPQINDWMDNWVNFFREKRLEYQVKLAMKQHLWNSSLDKVWQKFEGKLEALIGYPPEPPSLLHGDLWSGNQMPGPGGEPCIIDPAVYYGSREADLAMTELFGGFPESFYQGYREVYPLEPGYEDRSSIYKLYHLLNHLNLFGLSYLGSVKSILERYAG